MALKCRKARRDAASVNKWKNVGFMEGIIHGQAGKCKPHNNGQAP
jgi:hypothetical protein